MCKNVPHTVQILKKRDGNGRSARGALDASMISKSNHKEKNNGC